MQADNRDVLAELRQINDRLARLETRLESQPTALEFAAHKSQLAVVMQRLDAHERLCAATSTRLDRLEQRGPTAVTVGAAGGLGATVAVVVDYLVRTLM